MDQPGTGEESDSEIELSLREARSADESYSEIELSEREAGSANESWLAEPGRLNLTSLHKEDTNSPQEAGELGGRQSIARQPAEKQRMDSVSSRSREGKGQPLSPHAWKLDKVRVQRKGKRAREFGILPAVSGAEFQTDQLLSM